MLDEEALYLDIYGAESGYYTVLKKLNEEYTSIIKTQLGYGDNSLTNKKLKLVSDIQVEQARIYAATESIENIENGSGAGSKSEYEDIIKEANLNIKSKQSELAVVDKQLADCQKAIKDNVSKRKNLNDSFYTKYSRYIQEGTWTGDNYIEPNTYFFDAQKVITRNSRPQIEYNLDVVDVSVLIDPETQWDYSPYAFEVGDISSIIDTQYFGYDENGAPRAEKVVVSEVTYNLDRPEKNSIQIQNYSTQFEDLFSKLNASIQSLTLNQNTYAKAENFTGTGALTYESLQQSFDRNKALSESSANGTYTQENGVITLKTDGYDESTKEYIKDKYQVKLLGGGIILSSDGGATWKTGIYGGEINTALLKAGQIDAEKINIMMGNHPLFQWDKDGLTAFATKDDKDNVIAVQPGKYVRFNEQGLYGIIEKGKTPDISNANFALTWDGLRINLPYKKEDGKKLVIGVNADAEKGEDGIAHRFLVYNDGSMEAYNGTFTGTINGVDGVFSGTITAAEFKGMNRGKLIGPELMVGLKTESSETSENGKDYNFWVDSNGNVNITGGSISFNAFNQEAQDLINGKVDEDTLNSEINKINTTINGIKRVPDYIQDTYIDSTKIQSPEIIGNTIKVHGSFQTLQTVESITGTITTNVTGYMGYAEGSGVKWEDGELKSDPTFGVALSSEGNDVNDNTTYPYVIVTNQGARMSAGGASLLVSNGKAMFRQAGGNWQEIGSGVAVFG